MQSDWTISSSLDEPKAEDANAIHQKFHDREITFDLLKVVNSGLTEPVKKPVYKCNLCGLKLIFLSSLVTHKELIHSERLAPAKASFIKEFQDFTSMYSEKSEPQFSCGTCERTFWNRERAMRCAQRHEKSVAPVSVLFFASFCILMDSI